MDSIAGINKGHKVDMKAGNKTGTQGKHEGGHQDMKHKVEMMAGTKTSTQG